MNRWSSKTLYISDLDGTLLTPEVCLSPFTAETLQRLIGEGMLFSYATARSFATASKVTAALEKFDQPVIVYNGEAIVRASDGCVLDAVYFSPEDVQWIQKVLQAHDIHPMVYSRDTEHSTSEQVSYVSNDLTCGMQYYLETRKGDERLRVVSPEMLYQGQIYYFTAIVDHREDCEAAYAQLAAKDHFTVLLEKDVYSNAFYFEIMPKTATKADAVQRLASLYGCTRIVCFGDGVNDCSMFRIADAGYAVENASEVLKAEATEIIASNKEDGVAHKLSALWEIEKRKTTD